ncbi:hypothetical protein [Reinekea sp. G2M2-21]|uniref:hypothetical protein n=1 Tax=Reinekea sp. G2M2-21 TaxID=2788942 RepID=UPI0018AA9F41|nr:hypothetical protein [Reinekea sp. G2M2-21]
MNTQVEKLNIILTENAIEVEDFANCLGISVTQAEALCDGKKILSKALARQIEQTFSKPDKWLEFDNSGESEGPNYDLFG